MQLRGQGVKTVGLGSAACGNTKFQTVQCQGDLVLIESTTVRELCCPY